MACVLTSRQLTIDPAADCPSVMKIMVPSFFFFCLSKCFLQSLSCGTRIETALDRSRASFLTELSSLRSFWLSLIFSSSFSAAGLLRCNSSTTAFLTSATISERISVFPSLFLVCDSNTGSFRRMAMAPRMPSRTSLPSNFALAYSLIPLRSPSRKALK